MSARWNFGRAGGADARAPRRRVFRLVWAAAAILSCGLSARAQSQRTRPLANSDLERENMSRVAASAAEIKAVLVRDAGLLVELKHWVAKNDTDHGQIVSDADLTNDAIFARLESDVPFRSVATRLVQRYGYLLPRLNPDSEMAKERDLLVQERVRWIAQHAEEERARARAQARARQELETTGACNPSFDPECESRQRRPSEGRAMEQEPAPGSPPSRMNPNPPETPAPPPGSANPFERARMMQTSGESGNDVSQLALSGGYDASQMGGGSNAGAVSSLMQQMRGRDDEDAGSPEMRGTPDLQNILLELSMSGGGAEGALGGDAAGRLPATGGLPGSARTNTNFLALGAGKPPSRRNEARSLLQPTGMIRKPSPYEDIPSLYDMYLQAVPRPAAPRRFGMEIFENGTRDLQLIPMDLPVGPDYVVGPGDGLSISLWGGVSQRFYRTVDRTGRISLPEVGPVLVSEKSLADVQQNLQQILRTQYRGVSADVSLARLRTIRVYEVGDVASPGAYDVSSLSTPLNALFSAGGPTPRGSLRILNHYRGGRLVQVVDVYDLLLHGVKADIERLENGDTVQVPPIGPEVTVEGMVRRPAIYELREEKNLASVLELAGGLLPAAALRHIEVQRLIAHEKQTMLTVDIPEAGDASEVTQKLEAFEIKDGDRIRIFPIAPYSQDAIYLEGHVIRPGRYSYRADMRVTDVISSYKDLLPEPALQHAEIIRLNAPDNRPSVESFDLAEALANPSEAPRLHAMDTVRVFSRYDFENPPTVSVWGEVRQPGTYRTSGQIHLSDAVHLAGGLSPDAERTDAQVFRYVADGRPKIFSVRLDQALAGDPAENILLDPRDRVLIHRNPESVEPASVYIEGEVAQPGRYPLTSNMHVADLIRVGGGLKPSADTGAADLTRLEWASQTRVSGRHEPVAISRALEGDPQANVALHNGDVLTIRQVPGWNDLGASIRVQGEVKHPGTYGIRPGERLSSILERAGGFESGAYPYAAVLQRIQVRELEQRSQDEMVARVKSIESSLELLPDATPQQKQAKEAALQQYRGTLEKLTANPPGGRVSIRISSRIERWKNTAADVEVRAGDTLTIPKKPDYVIVTGQVYNPTAVSFRPGRSAKWYLSQSGGPTQMANKKAIFVIRADGSVVGTKESLWSGNSMEAVLESGDTVVVPEKAIGGGVQWQNVFTSVQVASSVASTVFFALHY